MAKATIGADVGGTFTDVVISDGESVWRAKAPTTPGNLGEGVLSASRLAAEQAGTTLEALLPTVDRFGLGTTAVTNTIASRTGRRIGLITTKGFEDLVPIARAMRIPTDGWLIPPESLVDREWILGVDERIDRTGTILRALEPADVVGAARRLIEEHAVEALTVSFLWSWVNPTHEKAAAAALGAALPEMTVTTGSSLLPVIREYERTTFALLNAYTSGALAGVDALVEELSELGLPHPPLLVHSGGGSISVREGHRMPATLAESGPAAGVVASLALCEALGIEEAVTCDTGGTSFDMSIITGGHAMRRSRGDLMGIWTALPMVDIESVGAGGGSIGWVDPLGILRVGPRSAGARPGPACYGRGGTDATVTDALLVLGYLDPKRFLGGDMDLDLDAATMACERLGQQLGADGARAAWGIWEIAKASMVRALRGRFAARGLDPRDHTMVSVGGCGGLFAAEIATELHIARVLVPELASVFSAFGAASADIRRERSRSVGIFLPADPARLDDVATELAAAVAADLEADGVEAGDRSITFEVDLRFHRQKWELSIPWNGGFTIQDQDAQLGHFREEYVRHYGSGAMLTGAPIDLVSMRAVGRGRTVRARLASLPGAPPGAAPTSATRTIDIGGDSGWVDVDVVLSEDLHPGHQLNGPCVVDSVDTTVWIPPGTRATVDQYGTIDMEIS